MKRALALLLIALLVAGLGVLAVRTTNVLRHGGDRLSPEAAATMAKDRDARLRFCESIIDPKGELVGLYGPMKSKRVRADLVLRCADPPAWE